MSQTERKTTRLGGAAGFSIHAVGKSTTYTRVELWRDVDNEADVLCSVALTGGAKRKDVLDSRLPAGQPSV